MTPSLRILHCLRAPIGGLFRHVHDLVKGQAELGLQVGVICDSETGGENAARALARLTDFCTLGVARCPMPRQIRPGDFTAYRRLKRLAASLDVDVLHGHGAKGGAYARLAYAGKAVVRAYTPHGGSLLLDHHSLSGRAYMRMERVLMPRGNLYLFESAFSADVFRAEVGTPPGLVRIIPNGVGKAEFEPVTAAADATDLVFIGELRAVKGIDTLLHAVALLHRNGFPAAVTLIGDGPDAAALRAHVASLSLDAVVRFLPAMPMRQALTRGKLVVIPSRAESMPYVVLEIAAAGRPMIATNVGGIPEIYGELSHLLVPPGDSPALAEAIRRCLADPSASAANAELLRARIAAGFSVDAMVDGVLGGYQQALERTLAPGRAQLARA